jgi:hypothetical protein
MYQRFCFHAFLLPANPTHWQQYHFLRLPRLGWEVNSGSFDGNNIIHFSFKISAALVGRGV